MTKLGIKNTNQHILTCESLSSLFRNLNLGGFYNQMLHNVVASWNVFIFIVSDDL